VLEPDPAGAARARAAGLHVLECRLQDLDGAFDASFDAVTLLDVFEHLEDSKQALQVARRLLRPGGVLVISTPNLGHWPIVRDLAMGRFDYTPVGSLCWTHVRFFTEASLTAMLNENGFTVEQVAAEPAPADAALEHFIEAAAAAGLRLDRRSLHMPALRVRARVD
jgi:2-polyprenyl-3-methyl-5-hydroxy-6-metoxy-1,4-benzoquinol methylase